MIYPRVLRHESSPIGVFFMLFRGKWGGAGYSLVTYPRMSKTYLSKQLRQANGHIRAMMKASPEAERVYLDRLERERQTT